MTVSQTSEQLDLFKQPVDNDPETIEILDRLQIMQREEGFLPTSRAELNEAFNLRTFAVGGAAKHLAEVAQHQQKHDADPQAAAVSLTRLYGGYGERARTDKTALHTLQEELSDLAGTNPLSSVDLSRLHTGLGQFVRFIDLAKLATTKDMSGFGILPLRGYQKQHRDAYDPYIDTHPSTLMKDHIQTRIGSIRVWEMRQGVEAAITDQGNRLAFWRARVQEIENYQMGQVRAVAREMLGRMGVRGSV
jgi:hypothetical protein